jgi:hypothetical protein
VEVASRELWVTIRDLQGQYMRIMAGVDEPALLVDVGIYTDRAGYLPDEPDHSFTEGRIGTAKFRSPDGRPSSRSRPSLASLPVQGSRPLGVQPFKRGAAGTHSVRPR